jgi:hypothetical protein
MTQNNSPQHLNKFLADHHLVHSKQHKERIKFVIFVSSFALIGSLSLLLTSAQTIRRYAVLEPELGTTTGTAIPKVVNDTNASGGKYIKFDAPAPVVVTPPPAPAQKVRRFPGDPNPKLYNKAYWGAGIDGGGSPSRHEDPTGVSLSIRRTFYQWSNATNMSSYMYSTVADDVSKNRLPFISIKTPGWKAVADGTYDAEIDAMLRKLDAYGKPIWFTVHHEPEGGGGNNFPDDPGGAFEWRRMQVKIRQRINAVGTKNIAFMPILMNYTWTSASGRNPADWWVDGIWDAYCVDHYRDSTSGDMFTSGGWNTFISWIEAKGLPYCLGEWGNRGTDAQAGQEMRDFWNWNFTNKKDVIGYAYFDSGLNSPSGSWSLVGEPLNVFRDILKNDSKVQRINDL